jgi:hypothetical protein
VARDETVLAAIQEKSGLPDNIADRATRPEPTG